MAVLAGKVRAKRRNCAPVAGKSTSNRLELGGASPSGNSKNVHDGSAIADVSVTLFLDAHEEAPGRVVLDFDATDDPVHGLQEGRFFHSYYDCYCYLLHYVLCGCRLPASRLRPAHIDGAAGAVGAAARVVVLLRARWPNARIADALGGGRGGQRAAGASPTSCGPRATVGAANAASSPRRHGPTARPIRASSSPRSPPGNMTPVVWTRTSTASAARWRTTSRAPVRPARRPRPGAQSARQPAPPVVRVDGPCAAPRPAPPRPRPHPPRHRHMRKPAP